MTPTELIAYLASRGIVLSLAAGALRYSAPKGALTSADRERLEASKADLVSHLQQATEGPATCCLCGQLMSPGRVYRCERCSPTLIPRLTEPRLVSGYLVTPIGYQPSTCFYELAISLGMPEHVAAERYCKPKGVPQ